MADYQRISVGDFEKRRKEGWEPYVLDVRKPHEAEIVRFDFADRLQPHENVLEIVGDLPRDRDIVVHCKMGGRSAQAAQALVNAGFDPSRIYNLEGGITGYAKEIDPSMPTY